MKYSIGNLFFSLLAFGNPAYVFGKANNGNNEPAPEKKQKYEVWAADQSNSAVGQSSLGVKGGFVWIYDSDSIEQMSGGKDAKPLPCSLDPTVLQGPCNLLDMFPQNELFQYNQGGAMMSKTLGELEGFGRLHGLLPDIYGRYVNANIFTPGGGYIGIIDTMTKATVGLFRVTKFNFGDGSSNRSVHMSFWSFDGFYITIANLNGKAVERINVIRDEDGTIVDLIFDKSATLGLGQKCLWLKKLQSSLARTSTAICSSVASQDRTTTLILEI
jgi:hypothetical protein